MELLLLKDVDYLGHVGDIVSVKVGYARNYLLPQRLAAEPTPENIAAIQETKKRAASERARRLQEYTDLVAKLVDVSVTIEATANAEGRLYGSVGPRDIAQALHGLGFGVAAEHVRLPEPIRMIDTRMVKLQFADGVGCEIKVWVVRDGASEAAVETVDTPDDDDERADN